MVSQRGCGPLQASFFCCISFVMGYLLAILRLPGIQQLDYWSHLVDKPGAFTLQIWPDATAQERDPKRDLLHAYLAELIDTTVGSEILRHASDEVEESKKLFRETLIQALTIENFGCEKGAKVVPRDQLPNPPPPTSSPTPPPVASSVAFEKPRERRIPGPIGLVHFSGLGKIDRNEFTEIIDTGSPLSLSKRKSSKVMIMYGSEATLPTNLNHSDSAVYADGMLKIPAQDAIANCPQLSVIHVKDSKEPVCWAFVPGQESFHIQKWLRVAKRHLSKSDPEQPLRLVSRGYDPVSGYEYPDLPSKVQAKKHRLWLGSYLSNIDVMTEELRPLVEKVAVKNKLIVTVVNAGQAELLLNFACAARNRGFTVKHILVFVLDEESKELVEGLGMTAYYNAQFLGVLPSNDPMLFGDTTFSEIVTAKFICTHLLSIMDYDFLFQDVDIVWYKDPLSFFRNPKLADPSFDIFFQVRRFSPIRGTAMRALDTDCIVRMI